MKKILTEWRNFLNEETIPLGQCYPFAVKMAKASSGEEFEDLSLFKVVHGRITDKYSGESVLHAWVEKGDMVFDAQTSHTKPGGIPKFSKEGEEGWYDMYQPEPHKEYTAEEAMLTCLRQGQMGPWD